jgi:hypothetical protein
VVRRRTPASLRPSGPFAGAAPPVTPVARPAPIVTTTTAVAAATAVVAAEALAAAKDVAAS